MNFQSADRYDKNLRSPSARVVVYSVYLSGIAVQLSASLSIVYQEVNVSM
jgi:hypothetical protein